MKICKQCRGRYETIECRYCHGLPTGLGAVIADHYEPMLIGGPGFFVKVICGLMFHSFKAGMLAEERGYADGNAWEEYTISPGFTDQTEGLDKSEMTGPVAKKDDRSGDRPVPKIHIEDLFEAFRHYHAALVNLNHAALVNLNSTGVWRTPKLWTENAELLQNEFKTKLAGLADHIDWSDRSDQPVQSTGPVNRSSE